ncbi:alanine racemase [Candidatus Peregrinibacteria bacterium]|nr:alanine racemase [Candidatus Peregrinibacteria bacterium]
MNELTWVEVSKGAIRNNIRCFREIIGKGKILCPCVKANAYGHGLVETAEVFLDSGADWLAVNAIYEARSLRKNGVDAPIYVLGYVPLDSLEEALRLDCRLVVYNKETVEKLGVIAEKLGKIAKVHLKAETGNNRQGLAEENLLELAKFIKTFKNIEIEGLSTHFANIEDMTDHSYAEVQLAKFVSAINLLEENGINIPIKHCANSAAILLFPETHFQMVRPGIAAYGMWPSNETYLSYARKHENGVGLIPALTWKTKIAQIKKIPQGEFVGYGCTYKTTHDTTLAILPVGYYDGYDRGLKDAYVLIHGKRAYVRGRICMNIIMVDVTDIPEAKIEDDVTLLGKDGDENISAELFAKWAGTINYEATTRINDRIPRIYV